jgi:lysozyme
MRGTRICCTVILLASSILAACATVELTRDSPEEAPLTPGIFLEPAERAALPPGVVLRKVYAKGLEVTKFFEGFRSRLYNDAAGYCTIAYGHLIKYARCDGNEPDEFRKGVSEPRGSELLVKDMEMAQRAVMTAVTADLSDGQYAALCDFAFNVGGGNLKSSTLLKVINAGQYERVKGQFLRWNKADGKEFKGLTKRREREIELFFDGLPTPRAAPPADEDLTPIDIRKGEK